MSYRPLSREMDPAWDEPVEGIPPFLRPSVFAWIDDILIDRETGGRYRTRIDLIRAMERGLRVAPFRRRGSYREPVDDLEARTEQDEEFGLDVIDYLLAHQSDGRACERLQSIVKEAGSAWEVTFGRRSARLTPRALRLLGKAVKETSTTTRAQHHLNAAWEALATRQPSFSLAYAESVKAVEVVAQPVVSSANAKSTLGTIIRDLRQKPTKWSLAHSEASVEDVARWAQVLWKTDIRHGTNDEAAPFSPTEQEAQLAVRLALMLVPVFTSEILQRVS